MDPHEQFCHDRRCRAYGRLGEGHVVIHTQKERRYRCKRCGRTFSETQGVLPSTEYKQAEVAGTRGGDAACLRLSGAGHRRRLRAR